MKKNDLDTIELIVDKAHNICENLLLFEAISMKEKEVRLFLNSQNITDEETQNRYLSLVEKYDKETG